ncbi:hypothetical protein AWQ21_15460 (plasmid) [Picosynechococcus sp. PCC 7003]|uniref:hypothetical protein n=1 Tax=Picosynechococcus sp. PCC 7003 TaxID=374981 RepID=UPI00081053D7|nr:hypothetical protein [Picosynechococcus sp. PCC 7003]ANV85923.1 hypothetical protein AWQ21_15460 [Picosynechococcus sp. PCC 7003]
MDHLQQESSLAQHQRLNTIEDNRWELFQRDVRRRRLLALGATSGAIALGYVTQSVWIFLAGEAAIWLILRYWRTRQK